MRQIRSTTRSSRPPFRALLQLRLYLFLFRRPAIAMHGVSRWFDTQIPESLRSRDEWIEATGQLEEAHAKMLREFNLLRQEIIAGKVLDTDAVPWPEFWSTCRQQYLSYLDVSWDYVVAVISFRRAARRSRKPGRLLEQVSEFVFSPRDHERVFLPILWEMRDEIARAVAQGRGPKAIRVRLRYTGVFWRTAIRDVPWNKILAVVRLIAKLIS